MFMLTDRFWPVAEVETTIFARSPVCMRLRVYGCLLASIDTIPRIQPDSPGRVYINSYLIMWWRRLFAFVRNIRCGCRFQFFLQDGDLQLQLIDQPVLINHSLVQYIHGVLEVGQPDFEFCNSLIHHGVTAPKYALSFSWLRTRRPALPGSSAPGYWSSGIHPCPGRASACGFYGCIRVCH